MQLRFVCTSTSKKKFYFVFPALQDCGKDPATGNPRRYMVLDGPVQYDPPKPRPHVVVRTKKKGLDIPAKILLG